MFWCPPCSSGCWGEGPRDPLSPQGWAAGANVCPSELCCNAKPHPETPGFIQLPDLTGLGQVYKGFFSVVQDTVEADQAFPWEKAQP